MFEYNKHLKANSRALRSNMTDAEKCLWSKVRRKSISGVQFYRQKPIGHYIVDFYAPAARLVVELDGGQHYEIKQKEKDQQRDAYLSSLGLFVLRFDNRQMLRETHAVVEKIYHVVCDRVAEIPPQIPPGPPFSKGGT